MSYALTLRSLHVLSDTAEKIEEKLTCHGAREGCMPSFVFSIEGQIGFRSALQHLATCQKMSCRILRSSVFKAMQDKMRWLMKEECLLGCVHIQPSLYGSRRLLMDKKGFGAIARHLANCPKESCAQLRRAVLLDIRDDLRPSQNNQKSEEV